MKRRLIPNALLSVMIATVGMGYSTCRPSTNNNPNTNGPNNLGRQSPTPTPTENTQGSDKAKGDLPEIAAADTAMIIRVERDVSLKAKGATDFVRILSGLFRGGDTLQVGDQSKAWVSCPDHSVCPLGTGLYAECCRDVCENGIRIPPPPNSESQNRVVFISKSELPPADLQMFQLQETRIRNLGADEVTTQFLMADLYSSWKLVEAKDELKDLTQKLNKPGTKQELKMLYVPMLRRTGDMQLRVKQQDEAEDSYKKAVELAPESNDPREKADAHVSLGQFYEKSGQKEKAVINLKQGEQLYERGGDVKKAAATRQAIVNIQKP
jgi:hypothetical protein